MARIALQAATLVALLAVVLQYLGYMPALPGLQAVIPRLGGRSPQNINAAKLLADLNSDVLPQEAGAAPSGGDEPHALTARAASAALSVMYLASLPGLKEQVKAAPGVVESLVRRLMTVDLAETHRLLTAVGGQQQHPQHQPTRQGGGGSAAAGAQSELLSSALMAVAQLAAEDPPLQAWLLGDEQGLAAAVGKPRAGKGVAAAVRRARPLPRGALLGRIGDALRSGVPAWQAAASVALHSLSGAARSGGEGEGRRVAGGPPGVLSWVAERAEELERVGRSLVEAGAHFNSSDAVLAGARLLELVAGGADGRRRVSEGDAPSLLLQVVLSHAGANSSSGNSSSSSSGSSMVGAAVGLLHRLVEGEAGDGAHSRAGGGEEAAAGAAAAAAAAAASPARVLHSRVSQGGLVAPLVREIRLGAPTSLGPSLELLVELMRGGGRAAAGTGAGSGRAGGGAGVGVGEEAAEQEDGEGEAVTREAVGAGILSLCAQLLFQASPDTRRAQSSCCWIVRHMVAHSRQRPGPGGGEEEQENGEATDGAGSALCGSGDGGRVALAGELMRIMRHTDLADLHNAVLDACRDVAPGRPAAVALVQAGWVPLLAALLAHNTTQALEQGGHDESSSAWVLQGQRSAAAILALLALQRDLGDRLVAEGGLTGLVTALRIHQPHPGEGRSGLAAQVRVTAAAALVPLLGDNGRYAPLVVTAGALEPLLAMWRSRGGPGGSPEGQVAARVLRGLAAGDPQVAARVRKLGLEL